MVHVLIYISQILILSNQASLLQHAEEHSSLPDQFNLDYRKGSLTKYLIMKTKESSFFFRNSLSIIFISLFILAIGAQIFFGWKENNEELADLGVDRIGLLSYLKTGHFLSATFENFQSEFLQMALYVILTVSLHQIGSAESKDPNNFEQVDRLPDPNREGAPWPVKKGGWQLILYQHSLSIAFILLFLISWSMHLFGSFKEYNLNQALHHKPPVALLKFIVEPKFWFETFQNWQSEFLSVTSIVILSIFLRQKGSPESKPVDAANIETGK